MTDTLNSIDSTHQWVGVEEPADLFTLLCERRGWTDDYLTAVDRADHEQLKDLDTMVAALDEIRRTGGVITIAPDFDMDGISSGVLGYAGLRELGFQVNLHLPDYRRGHELTVDDIVEIHQRFPNTTTLLTCDGGVNSHAGIAAARALGWQTLVTDHHQELPPGCNADITVNPCRIDETYALRGICGAHVLYQVLESYAATHLPIKLWEIRLLRLFAGLGTISDVMPVLYENRQIVRDSLSIARLLRVPAPLTIPNRFGGFDPDPEAIDPKQATLLQLLAAGPDEHDPVFVSAFEGFAVLMKAFAIEGKLRSVDDLDEGFYGFYLAPVMNSPRRIGTPLSDCFTAFLGSSMQLQFDAAHRLIMNNERRKEMLLVHLQELLDADQPLAPQIYFSDAPGGMLGLLANAMMQRTGLPVVVLRRPLSATEPTSGSGRAPEWFDIIDALAGNDQFWAIGHQQACGVKVASASALDELAQVLSDATQVAIAAVDATDAPRADLMLGEFDDCDAPLSDVEQLLELTRRIEELRPFGHGFVEPKFEFVLSDFRLEVIGSEDQHVRLVTRHGLVCLWWNAVEDHYHHLEEFLTDPDAEPLRFLGRLQLNTFRDQLRVQVVIDEEIQ